jgi:protoporphyrinogen oxidase
MTRVAIIGSGVSGLAAATILHENNIDFEIFEADAHIGGHAHTVMVMMMLYFFYRIRWELGLRSSAVVLIRHSTFHAPLLPGLL